MHHFINTLFAGFRGMNHVFTKMIAVFGCMMLVACSTESNFGDGTGTSTEVTTPDQVISVAAQGLFCSCAPTNESASSVFRDAGDIEYLDGILVRVGWDSLEPAPGVYDWTLLDEQITKAEEQGLEISLAVLNGPKAPAWLADEGAVMFEYFHRGEDKVLPVPWDPVYLERVAGFIHTLGQRYNDNKVISLIHMTNATTNGFEMHYLVDSTDEAEFVDLGYTERRMIDSWITILDAYNQAFPEKLLDVEVHPIFRLSLIHI